MAVTKMTRTGFCIMGQHEGERPRNYLNEPLPVCLLWEWCKCSCHKKITDMYEMAGVPREAQPNPDFHHPKSSFWMPSDEDFMALHARSNIDGGILPPDNEQPVPAIVGTPTRHYEPTPTGRKARGQLEYEVLAICRDFSNGTFDWPDCTPKLIAEEIGHRNATEPPSTGAIAAVWDRWTRLGIVQQGKKPLRFISFTDGFSGTEARLELVKMRAKRDRKRMKSARQRGLKAFEV